jgi:hypothetical protein
MDRKIAMNAMPRQQSATIMDLWLVKQKEPYQTEKWKCLER